MPNGAKMKVTWQIVFYRLVIELASIAGVIAAAILAYADKSPWVWVWFLAFGFFAVKCMTFTK